MGSALLDAASAAYPAMAEFYASDWAALEARNEGLYVCSGCAISASGTAGKVDMSAGAIFATSTELNVAAVVAATTTITTLADATNPKWVGLEIDNSGVLQFNQGTAAASPVKPALTAARVIVAWLYVPATATAVDALLSTANGKAKIMDARQLMTAHPARKWAQAVPAASLTNPTSLTSLLDAAFTIPANSLSVGDRFDIDFAGVLTNNSTNSTFRLQATFGGQTSWNYTTPSLTTSASTRDWSLHLTIVVSAIGATANAVVGPARFVVSPAVSANVVAQETVGGGAAGDAAVVTRGLGASFDSRTDTTIDLQTLLGTSAAAAVVHMNSVHIVKTPA
jgi:hypothetical protein